jgi:hypothetical protein
MRIEQGYVSPALSHFEDEFLERWNMYMTPQEAVRGMELLRGLPDDSDDLVENPPYRDLTTFKVFKP